MWNMLRCDRIYAQCGCDGRNLAKWGKRLAIDPRGEIVAVLTCRLAGITQIVGGGRFEEHWEEVHGKFQGAVKEDREN